VERANPRIFWNARGKYISGKLSPPRTKDEYGDYIIAISDNNQKLTHWVSNERKQYNLREARNPSSLTEDHFEQLDSIGLVWNRWEY
jgi:hypothetical protein